MGGNTVPKPYVSYADYLAAERVSETKHEWLRGEVHAMAGGTPEHARLQMAIGAALTVALRGKPCVTYGPDLRVRIAETELATYPDATVVCGSLETHPDDPDAATNPTLIVEVLSPSTEAYDRGEKLRHYRRLRSLREIVYVAQGEPRIEVFRRIDGNRWEILDAGAGEAIELTSVGCTLRIDEVYGASGA